MWGRRVWGRVVVGVLVSLVVPGAAAADQHAISFDALPLGTTVTDQFKDAGGGGQGVVFGIDNHGNPAGNDAVVESDANLGHNVVSIWRNMGGEFFTDDLWGVFGDPPGSVTPKRYVSLDAGAYVPPLGGSTPLSMTLTAYDAGGAMVGSATRTLQLGGQFQTFAVSDSSVSDPCKPGRIAFFRLAPTTTNTQAPPVAVQAVAYDVPCPGTPPPPHSYGIAWTGPGYQGFPPNDFGTTQGHSISTTIAVTRLNGSSGPLQFKADNVPPNVNVSFSPAQTTSASTVTVTFDAQPDAAPADHQDVVITATPVDSAQSGSGSPGTAHIPLTILAQSQIRIRGIEVLQAVQSLLSTEKAGHQSDVPQLPARDENNPAAPVNYSGVNLAAGGKTFARVWASVANPTDLSVDNVQVELHGFDKFGQEIPGSPLISDPMTIGPDPRPFVAWDDLAGTAVDSAGKPEKPWNIELPFSWTLEGPLRLTATLIVPKVFSAISQAECETALCAAEESFTLTGIPFTDTNDVQMTVVKVTYPSEQPLKKPGEVFKAAEDVIPTFDGGLDFNHDNYAGSLDITDVLWKKIKCDHQSDGQPMVDQIEQWQDCNDNADDDTLGAVEDWGDNNPRHAVLIGVDAPPIGKPPRPFNESPGRGDEIGSIGPGSPEPHAIVDQSVPLSSVAHELSHALGRNHASQCGGGSGDDWPPDQEGWIHGIGFDRTGAVSAFGAAIATSFALLPAHTTEPDGTGDPTPGGQFDYMSYCGATGRDWISTDNWNGILQDLHDHNGGNYARDAHAAAASGPAIRVLGYASDEGVKITKVAPVLGGPAATSATGPATSSYSLQVKAAHGEVLASAPMQAIGTHNDPTGTPVVFLAATVPVPGAAAAAGVPHAAAGPPPASVAILSGGTVMATRTRPPHVPVVRLTLPAAGATIGRGRSVAVRFAVHDPDHAKLTVKVDYSHDDGRTFATLWMGPMVRRVTLPSALLSASRAARIRVRVSDGFNEGRAVSGRLLSVGRLPAVTITSPIPGIRLRADGALDLAGTAVDDQGRKIAAKALSWFAGRRLLGHGTHLQLTGLPAGRVALKLLARGRDGRVGEARVAVPVAAVAPAILSLSTPTQLAATAQSMTIRIATTVPAQLVAGTRRFLVSRRIRTLRIPVPANSERIPVELASGRLTNSLLILMPRDG
jgi:hypothetical protein